MDSSMFYAKLSQQKRLEPTEDFQSFFTVNSYKSVSFFYYYPNRVPQLPQKTFFWFQRLPQEGQKRGQADRKRERLACLRRSSGIWPGEERNCMYV